MALATCDEQLFLRWNYRFKLWARRCVLSLPVPSCAAPSEKSYETVSTASWVPALSSAVEGDSSERSPTTCPSAGGLPRDSRLTPALKVPSYGIELHFACSFPPCVLSQVSFWECFSGWDCPEVPFKKGLRLTSCLTSRSKLALPSWKQPQHFSPCRRLLSLSCT